MSLICWDFAFISIGDENSSPMIAFNSKAQASGFIKLGLTGVYLVRVRDGKIVMTANCRNIILDDCEAIIKNGRLFNRLLIKEKDNVVFKKLLIRKNWRHLADPSYDSLDIEASDFFLWIWRICNNKTILSDLKTSWQKVRN